MSTTPIGKPVEEALEDLAESLQIPPSRYEAAERSYKAVGDWLHRADSSLRSANPQVYIQGSFQLGTAIRPVSDDEDYDVDIVCELSRLKIAVTQAALKASLGSELAAYAKAHKLKPPEPGRRCWTLNYADGAQFHLDTLPAIPDGARQRLMLQQRGFATRWSETAIAITDRDHRFYNTLTEDWPHSNPKGYSEWFRSRMATQFEARRKQLASAAKAAVEKIPEHEVRTPLQYAIQILKRHRDELFIDRNDEKPISIILTTLASHAYSQEPTIAAALLSILTKMDQFIEDRNGVYWIPNPTDPAENFADRWAGHPKRESAFREWLQQAREDFAAAARADQRAVVLAKLQRSMGRKLIETARARRPTASTGVLSGVAKLAKIIIDGPHRQQPPWTPAGVGSVVIEQAIVKRNGFRDANYSNDGPPIPKSASLRFEAETDVPKPYKVFWQVVNTGAEARAARGLRGDFDEGIISAGKLTRGETTLYAGRHSIECFIVKDGRLAARSGQFVVNIQ